VAVYGILLFGCCWAVRLYVAVHLNLVNVAEQASDALNNCRYMVISSEVMTGEQKFI